jgi:hypothetical protein
MPTYKELILQHCAEIIKHGNQNVFERKTLHEI